MVDRCVPNISRRSSIYESDPPPSNKMSTNTNQIRQISRAGTKRETTRFSGGFSRGNTASTKRSLLAISPHIQNRQRCSYGVLNQYLAFLLRKIDLSQQRAQIGCAEANAFVTLPLYLRRQIAVTV